MDKLLDVLNSGYVVTGDGAFGTMLQQHSDDSISCLEQLNQTKPDVVKALVKSYLEEGAEIIQANTFSASPLGLAVYGLEELTKDLNRRAVEISREVVGDKAWISGSCSPSGRTLLPFGDLDPEDCLASYKVQMEVLAEYGVDCFCIETMMDVEEGIIAIRAARETAPDIPVLASATFNSTPNGFVTPFGNSIEEVARKFSDEGADVIGANCSQGIDSMVAITREFRRCSQKPILIRPNAGLPETVNGIPVWKQTPEDFARGTLELLEEGVSIIGGCCGTTPQFIRQVRNVVDDWRSKG